MVGNLQNKSFNVYYGVEQETLHHVRGHVSDAVFLLHHVKRSNNEMLNVRIKIFFIMSI